LVVERFVAVAVALARAGDVGSGFFAGFCGVGALDVASCASFVAGSVVAFLGVRVTVGSAAAIHDGPEGGMTI
jgi:hypothetical protein